MTLALLVFALLFFSCSNSDELIIRPQHPDIFNKFTTRRILPASALPHAQTNIKFFPGSDEFLVLNKSGVVYHFILEDLGARFLGSFTIPEVAPAPVGFCTRV